MAKKCSSVLVKCMDFRMTKDVYNWMEKEKLVGDCDVISVAGVTKELAENPKGLIFSNIKTAVDLHGVSDVYLMHHQDCGAYGGSKAFSTLEEELERYLQDMRKAREIILSSFPQVKIHPLMAYLNDDGTWRVENIGL